MNSHTKSPLYFNVQQLIGYNQLTAKPADVNKQPSILEIFNEAPFLKKADDYFIGVQRALIPISDAPRLIVPLAKFNIDGSINTNPNKLLYIVSLAYRNIAGDIIFSLSDNVIYQPEFKGGAVPSVINGVQDFTTNRTYYFVYDVQTLLTSINQTIIDMWGKFRVGCQALGVDVSLWTNIPYYSFDVNNSKFNFNADERYMLQDPITTYLPDGTPTYTQRARVEFFTDGLLQDLFQNPSIYFASDLRYGNVNLIFRNTVSKLDYVYTLDNNILKIPSWKSSLNMWYALTKIVFTINYGIATKLEYLNQLTSDGSLESNNVIAGVRPLRPILTDIQVDIDNFAYNNNFITYQTSSISQIRLIDITTNQDLKDFQVSVSWISNYNISYDLVIPTGQPLDLKLAFYPKTTTLI